MCKHQFLIPVEKILAEEFFLKSYMHIPHANTDISLLFRLYYSSCLMKAQLHAHTYLVCAHMSYVQAFEVLHAHTACTY